MQKFQKGFVIPLILILITIVGIGAYFYLNNTKSKSEGTTEKSLILPIGFSQYQDNILRVFYPAGWTLSTSTYSSHGCNIQLDIVQNPTPKEILQQKDLDDLHNLQNTGSVISLKGGVGETSSPTNYLNQIDERNVKLSFFKEEVEITKKETDLVANEPSVTFEFNFPKYNKKGVAKFIFLKGEISYPIGFYYIAPQKDFSPDLLNTVVSSMTANLKVCNKN